jgi:hypothetical protein
MYRTAHSVELRSRNFPTRPREHEGTTFDGCRSLGPGDRVDRRVGRPREARAECTTNLEMPKWLSGVNEEEAVELARDLLLSKAGLHGLALDCFTISARVKTKDGGVDGLSNFPRPPACSYPQDHTCGR